MAAKQSGYSVRKIRQIGRQGTKDLVVIYDLCTLYGTNPISILFTPEEKLAAIAAMMPNKFLEDNMEFVGMLMCAKRFKGSASPFRNPFTLIDECSHEDKVQHKPQAGLDYQKSALNSLGRLEERIGIMVDRVGREIQEKPPEDDMNILRPFLGKFVDANRVNSWIDVAIEEKLERDYQEQQIQKTKPIGIIPANWEPLKEEVSKGDSHGQQRL